MQEMQVRTLGREDPLEKEMACLKEAVAVHFVANPPAHLCGPQKAGEGRRWALINYKQTTLEKII